MIKTVTDFQRGCGWRKEGGLYIVGGGIARECGRLPIPLTICPTCYQGIKPTRGFTYVNPVELIKNNFPNVVNSFDCQICEGTGNKLDEACEACEDGIFYKADPCKLANKCGNCHLSSFLETKAGLIWVGEAFYATPHKFNQEAAFQGISRRVSAVPSDIIIGKTPIFLAHQKTVIRGAETPGIFSVFIPTAIEYITKGDETEEEIEKLEKRGITPVKVEKSFVSPALKNSITN